MKKLTNFCVNLAQRFLPDPFLFAILLSAIMFGVGVLFNNQTPFEMIIHWGNGFWGFLAFGMQMALVIILGNALATAPVFDRLVQRLAEIPKSPKQAVAFVTFGACIACMIQWGFGLVIGAILAKEVAKKVKAVDYRLLIASAYSAFLLTVLTSSITLKAASNPEELLVVSGGVLNEVIPLTRTAYHPVTLAVLLILLITLPILNASMHPSPDKTVTIDPALLGESKKEIIRPEKPTPAERMEHSSLISVLVFVCGAVYIFNHFAIKKSSLNIDIMNFMLFMLGILLHKAPIRYVNAIKAATSNASGIILQFPFYAGIMGMMTGVNSMGVSIGALISQVLVSSSNQYTFPFLSFISAAIVNMFVPSAGGQWAVQAPVMFPAGAALGVDPALTTMSLCWGDTWTNMIQPFWALPALGIAKLGVRDIMGFCVVVTLWSGLVVLASMMVWTLCF